MLTWLDRWLEQLKTSILLKRSKGQAKWIEVGDKQHSRELKETSKLLDVDTKWAQKLTMACHFGAADSTKRRQARKRAAALWLDKATLVGRSHKEDEERILGLPN